MGSQLDPLPVLELEAKSVPPSLNFPQLDFVKPSSGFHPVTWECINTNGVGNLMGWRVNDCLNDVMANWDFNEGSVCFTYVVVWTWHGLMINVLAS